jgi:hypothetical protein
MLTGAFRIRSTGPGRYEVHLDDQDLTMVVCDRVEITTVFGSVPEVVIRPCVVEINADLPHARLYLSADTQALLARFGWTPPPDADLARPGNCGGSP